MNSEPPPFGDPTNIRNENAAAVKKGFAVGCGGCATILLIFVGLALGGVAIVLMFMRSSEACTESLRRAQSSPVIRKELGDPVRLGWFITGNVNVTGDSGSANLSVPVSGPKGSLRIQTEATRQGGRWEYHRMSAQLASGETLDLLHPLPAKTE